MNEQKFERLKQEIDAMSHVDLCRRWRFSKVGDPMFQGVVGDYFKDRLFKHFGGFTKEISKEIGWDR